MTTIHWMHLGGLTKPPQLKEDPMARNSADNWVVLTHKLNSYNFVFPCFLGHEIQAQPVILRAAWKEKLEGNNLG